MKKLSNIFVILGAAVLGSGLIFALVTAGPILGFVWWASIALLVFGSLLDLANWARNREANR